MRKTSSRNHKVEIVLGENAVVKNRRAFVDTNCTIINCIWPVSSIVLRIGESGIIENTCCIVCSIKNIYSYPVGRRRFLCENNRIGSCAKRFNFSININISTGISIEFSPCSGKERTRFRNPQLRIKVVRNTCILAIKNRSNIPKIYEHIIFGIARKGNTFTYSPVTIPTKIDRIVTVLDNSMVYAHGSCCVDIKSAVAEIVQGGIICKGQIPPSHIQRFCILHRAAVKGHASVIRAVLITYIYSCPETRS